MSWDYKKNLERAMSGGLIQGDLENLPLTDNALPHFPHDGKWGYFNPSNCRGLDPGMIPLLLLLDGKTGAFGELGGGAGKALSDVHCLMEKYGLNHELINLSARPIDPYVLLRFELIDIITLKRGRFKSITHELTAPNKRLLQRVENPFSLGFEAEAIVKLQEETGSGILEHLQAPYIADQRIGLFPGDIDLLGLEKRFLWLYDNFGAFYYTHETQARETYSTINNLVSEEGVFLAVGSNVKMDEINEIREHFPEDVIVYGTEGLLIVRGKSPVLKFFLEEFPKIFKDKKVVLCEDMGRLFRIALRKIKIMRMRECIKKWVGIK